jgi:hypothetical protein
MTARLLAVSFILGALNLVGAVEAQEVARRVRLTMADGRRLNFDLLRVEAEGLVGRTAGRLPETERLVRFDEILRAERSLGRRRGRNAVRGALVGAAIGAFFLWKVNSPSSDEGCNVASACVPMFVLAPAAVGAGVGTAVSSERWEPISLGARPSLALRFSVRF